MKECKHELKTLSEPVVDIELTFLSSGGYFCPPIFQCVKCLKVFKTGYDECELVEIPVKTVEELEKEHDEQKLIKCKVDIPIWLIAALIGGAAIIITILILCMV